MLKKCLKYDFLALKRTLLPIIIGIVGMGILTGLFLGCSILLLYTDSSTSSLLGGVTVLGTIIGYVAIIAGFTVSTVLIYVRYYKNLMTDEGYLTFTLPVTSAQQLSSKLISTLASQIIAFVAVIISVVASLLIGLGLGGVIDGSIWREIGIVLREIWESLSSMGAGYIIMMIVFMLLTWVTSALMMFLAITLGNLAAKKGKVIASIGFYFALSYGLEILILIATFLLAPVPFDVAGNVTIWYVILIWNVIYAIAGVIAYWLTERLQRTKLNLN